MGGKHEKRKGGKRDGGERMGNMRGIRAGNMRGKVGNRRKGWESMRGKTGHLRKEEVKETVWGKCKECVCGGGVWQM